jgi:[NiFe] hydrogenase diaphorase moiety large subunit
VLKLCGATDAIAVQMGGPSGQMIAPGDFGRTICYDDLATGGAIMVLGPALCEGDCATRDGRDV